MNWPAPIAVLPPADPGRRRGLRPGGRKAQDRLDLAAGVILGSSIALMHFTGMRAFLPSAMIRWDRAYVIAAVVTGVALSMATMFAAQRSARPILYAAGLLCIWSSAAFTSAP